MSLPRQLVRCQKNTATKQFHMEASGSSCAEIRECTKDPEIVHRRTREVYESLSMDRESLVKSRADQSLLAKLRTGHFIGLRA